MNKSKRKKLSPLQRDNTVMMVTFLTPAVLLFIAVYLYPVLRTLVMSVFKVEGITDPVSDWRFNGIQNYLTAFDNKLFVTSMQNFATMFFIGGAAVLVLALTFAVILTSGLRGQKFFRSVIYLPNLISAVAMGNMWLYYVFNKESYGLLNSVITFFGGENVFWTDINNMFTSMLIAYCFGMVGYHMLIFISGIERIGASFYEAARIEGASVFDQFFYITLPLLKGAIRTNIIMWTVSAVGFYVWAQVFSPVNLSEQTVMPLNYMYTIVFGSTGATVTARDSGVGAAIGVMMAIVVILVFFLTNKLVKNDDVEL